MLLWIKSMTTLVLEIFYNGTEVAAKRDVCIHDNSVESNGALISSLESQCEKL